MSKFTALISKFAREDDGAALIEYTILIGIVAIAAVAAAAGIGGWIGPRWVALCTALAGAASCS